jgi:hypothetical protein
VAVSELPKWVYDLIADLLDEEVRHPADGYWMQRYDGQYLRWDWCPRVALGRVPVEIQVTARVIAAYRHESGASPPEPTP